MKTNNIISVLLLIFNTLAVIASLYKNEYVIALANMFAVGFMTAMLIAVNTKKEDVIE